MADEALEGALYHSRAMRSFAGIDSFRESVPDASTVWHFLHFRHPLEAHVLTDGIFTEANAHLEDKQLLLRESTMVDATIIATPSSMKNQRNERDPDKHQTRKSH